MLVSMVGFFKRVFGIGEHVNDMPFSAKSIYNILLSATNEHLVIINNHGEILFINDAACRFFSQSREALMGQSFFRILRFVEDKMALEAKNINKILDKNFQQSFFEGVEIYDILSRKKTIKIKITPLIEEIHVNNHVIIFQDISENNLLRYELDFLKKNDIITGLPNYNAFLEKTSKILARAKRYNTDGALLLIGLSDFGLIQDTLGQKQGGLLLRKIAERIQEVIRETDVLARLDTDNFLLFIDRLTSPLDAAKVANYIIKAFSQPFQIETTSQFMNICIGISIFPQDEVDMSVLIQYAKIALIEAKEKQESSYQFYSESLQFNVKHRIHLSNDLREALRSESLDIYFQPQIDFQKKAIVGFEAQVRWNHRVLGEIPPAVFMPLAQEMGCLVMIDRFLFRTACSYYPKWQALGFAGIKIAINLSAKELNREDSVSFILGVIKDYQIPFNTIQIEITENILENNIKIITEKCEILKKQGLEIVIDNFGTGSFSFSGLSGLIDIPVDVLKLDKQFLVNLNNPIIHTIIDLAKNLGRNLVAEGIETLIQHDYLISQRCYVLQGDLYAKAMTPDAAIDYIKNIKIQAPNANRYNAKGSMPSF